MYQLCMIEYLLVTIVYHTTATRGSLLCKEEPCSCCRSGTCADPHKHVFPCHGCIDGYTGPSCYEPCPKGCVNCSQLFYEYESERECYLCKAGFYTGKYKDIRSYPLQQDCSLPCNENCEMCTSYYNCSRCKPQFYLAYGKDCIRCLDNCLLCTSGTDCLACEDQHVWNGVECVTCEAGYFGTNCSRRCPDTCINNLCDKSTGICIFCNDGYFMNQDKICLKCPEHCIYCLSNAICSYCTAGYMGDTCQYKCSNCKPGTACELYTGYCLDSCRNGSSGEDCDTPCSEGCVDKLCGRKTGECLNGCLTGLSGSRCSIVEDTAISGTDVRAVAVAIAGATFATSVLGVVFVCMYIRRKNGKLPVSRRCCNALLHCRDVENTQRSNGPLVLKKQEAIHADDVTEMDALINTNETKYEETTLIRRVVSTASIKATDEEKGKSGPVRNSFSDTVTFIHKAEESFRRSC